MATTLRETHNMQRFFESIASGSISIHARTPSEQQRVLPQHEASSSYSPLDQLEKSTSDESEDYFSILRPFENDFADADASYNPTKDSLIISELSRSNQLAIGDFLKSDRSGILPMHVDLNLMERLTLEIARMFDHWANGPATIRVTHLCGVKANLKGARPEIMALDLLSQLLNQHEASSEQPRPRNGLVTKTDDLDGHWAAFRDYVRQAGIDYLLILLDRIDALLQECKEHGALSRFQCFVRNLRSLPSQLDGTVVKIMVTCEEIYVAEWFQLPLPDDEPG
ncbi:hypothetical protein MFIFM68171_08112 [Madurella fahalii]|uniref:Uncharacterized protein n=1 Tax=Madurella fahalii TaxID=1157608 RepID=A0ABQ0GJG3_9PEZI